ncbi:TPA: DUF2335 domain-containing protein [Streptococcus suis]|uniref:DUF2335 domain-containing protein n=1 Tax=Streptococcus suis TaxID=1307 RepID=UPI000CF459F2|nr:DUF2335 domain-containing protein [Streptococcus suis]NQI71266.1 DUF2335 domain-containing protein [Streptococcus suis]HEM4128982.1 DUF2335 domain-containing protein [Streptococcus suis]
MDTKQNELKQIDTIVEEVERLPKEERQVVLEKLEIYQGDLPHPDILQGYNKLYPDAAKRIIENGIAETEHRRKMEERYLSGNILAHRLGQILGFIVALTIVGSGTFLIFTGHAIAGSIMTGTTALGVIGLFTGNANKNN